MDQTSSHVQQVAAVHADGFVNSWFDAWRSALAIRHALAQDADDQLPLRETVLEALSDSSAEQCLSPLLARHMRRFGRRYFEASGLWFWVRSEWEKVDLCYGLAPSAGFPNWNWNTAWTAGHTGDLGQIEAKVLYAHYGESLISDRLKVLGDQLRARRDYGAKTATTRPQDVHGLVWLMQHRADTSFEAIARKVEHIAGDAQLVLVRAFDTVGADQNLGRLWPSMGNADYDCAVTLALVKLAAPAKR